MSLASAAPGWSVCVDETADAAVLPEWRARAATLAQRLHLPLAGLAPALPVLRVGEQLQARWLSDDQPAEFHVDFVHGVQAWRRQHGGGSGEPLARAIAGRSHAPLRVLDATTGWARDAFLLAALGHQVIALERQPLVYALVQDGLQRATQDAALADVVARIDYRLLDAKQLLTDRAACAAESIDVIYLDPMFPPRPGSAKVKKDMQLLQLLAEHDDGDALLAPALQCAGKRVIVKRPDYAPPLAGRKPSSHVPAGSNRFDCYVATPSAAADPH